MSEPSMVAAWPGMGYLAKISVDYLCRHLQADLFSEIKYYKNAIFYKEGLAELQPIKHSFYSVKQQNLIICIGEAQPSIPEEAYRLARCIVSVAKRLKVKRIYTMAALQSDYSGVPKVYGVYTKDKLRDILLGQNISILNGDGVIKGLNGILIGVAMNNSIEGICLMGEIKYANVPQHLSAKVVLDKLMAILDIEIDTQPLEKRAERLDASIRRKLTTYQDQEDVYRKDEKNFRYIS